MKLTLKTLTPVAVSDGNNLSNITDYYLEDSRIHYIDQEKVREYFKNKPDLIDKFVNITLKAHDNNRSKIHYKYDILDELMKVNPQDYVKCSVPAYGLKDSSNIQINSIIKTAGRPFIPGSSIKGAIKTALLYDWLTEIEEGKKFIENICNKLHQNSLKRKEIDIKISEELENYAIQREKNKFAKQFKISDTNSVPIKNMGVFHTQRMHLSNPKKQGQIPIVTEAVMPDIILQFDFNDEIKHSDFPDIIQKVRNFNDNVLEFEADILEKTSENVIDGNTYNKAIENIDYIGKLIDKNEDKMYLRIGSGKSNLNNSIGLAIYNKDQEAYRALRRIYNIGNKNSKLFPLTRSVISQDYNQLGWVEISQK